MLRLVDGQIFASASEAASSNRNGASGTPASSGNVLHDAVAEELIASNPCVLKKSERPQTIDKDRSWRRTAVFTKPEVDTIGSAPIDVVPEDRHVAYSLTPVRRWANRGGRRDPTARTSQPQRA